jgi:hypothetical protein
MSSNTKDMKAKYSKDETYPFPSRFGSHTSMLCKEEDKLKDLPKDQRKKLKDNDQKEKPDPLVVLEDENGLYVTDARYLDNGLSDANRYLSNRLKIAKVDEKKS